MLNRRHLTLFDMSKSTSTSRVSIKRKNAKVQLVTKHTVWDILTMWAPKTVSCFPVSFKPPHEEGTRLFFWAYSCVSV